MRKKNIKRVSPGWGSNSRSLCQNASMLSPRLLKQLIQETPTSALFMFISIFQPRFTRYVVHCGSWDQVAFLPTWVYLHTALRNPRSVEVLERQPFYYQLYNRPFPEKMLPKEYSSSWPNSFLPSDRQTTQVCYAKIFLNLQITSPF